MKLDSYGITMDVTPRCCLGLISSFSGLSASEIGEISALIAALCITNKKGKEGEFSHILENYRKLFLNWPSL